MGQRLKVVNAHPDGTLSNGEIVYMVNSNGADCIGVSRTKGGDQLGNKFMTARFVATSSPNTRNCNKLLLLERV